MEPEEEPGEPLFSEGEEQHRLRRRRGASLRLRPAKEGDSSQDKVWEEAEKAEVYR